MIRSRSLLSALLPLVVVHLHLITAAAGVTTYTEDFTSTVYRDGVATTADWNTWAEELRLHPFSIEHLSTYATPGEAYEVAVDGDYAYVANHTAGLLVLGVGDPAGPVLKGTCNTPGHALDVAVAGTYAYIADGGSGLQVIDIRDRWDPVLAGSHDTPGAAYGVAVDGNHACVADYTSGLRVFDITDPTNPSPLGDFDTPGQAHDVAIAGDYAYVASYDAGLCVVHIADLVNPWQVGSYYGGGYVVDVAVDGHYAYLAGSGAGLEIVDISDPTNPILTGGCAMPSYGLGVAVSGDYAYITGGDSGLFIVDVSDPTNPTHLVSYDTPGNAGGIAVYGEYGFVSDRSAGVHILRISADTGPHLLGSVVTPGEATALDVDGDYVFVADPTGGVQVIDASNPASPTLIAAYATVTGDEAEDVAVAGRYAYVAVDNHGLEVVDISDPSNPLYAGDCGTGNGAQRVAISGDHAFLTDGNGGRFHVVDITHPEGPESVGHCSLTGDPTAVVVHGDYAFVCTVGGPGIIVIDISNPSNPIPVMTGSGTGETWDMAIADNRAYFATVPYGFSAMDITNPTTPLDLMGYGCQIPGGASSVAVAGDRAFVTDLDGHLHVIDVTGSSSKLSQCDLPGHTQSVAIVGSYAYVADAAFGTHVLEVSQNHFDTDSNVGQSLDVESREENVIRARLQATHTDTINWFLSVDAGATLEDALPDGSWYEFTGSGHELVWRSEHHYTGGGLNPKCSSMTLDWLYDHPLMSSIEDVPNDQGRHVRLSWLRSGHDFPGDSTPVTEYAVFRRIDPVAAASVRTASEVTGATLRSSTGHQEGTPDGERAYPPGDWEFIVSVPAFCEDGYAVTVPTAADSTISSGMHYSVYLVRAATAEPSVYYDAPPDSGYSIDNLVPHVPTGFAIAYGTTTNELSWDGPVDEDFQYFRIYRSTDPDFAHGPGSLIHSTIDVSWTDETSGLGYYYKITAVDFSGNESDPSLPESVTGLPDHGVPGDFALLGNTPNPVSGSTTIHYAMPAGEHMVRVEVFTASGRLVRRLVDGYQPSGVRHVVWDSKDESGMDVAAGIYYCRLAAEGAERQLKIVVLR